MLSNAEVAILQKVNELVESYGVPACEVVITLDHTSDGRVVLAFEAPPAQAMARQRIERMFEALGVDNAHTELTGRAHEIYALIGAALRRTPGSSRKHR